MRFVGIWYDETSEIKRDTVDAANVNEASKKLYALYAGRKTPGRCLAITPESDGDLSSYAAYTPNSY